MNKISIITGLALLSVNLWAAPVLINSPETWDSGTAAWKSAQYSGTPAGTPIAPSGTGSLAINVGTGFSPAIDVYADLNSSVTGGAGTGKFQGDFGSYTTSLGTLGVKFQLKNVSAPNTSYGSLTLFFVGGGNEWVYESTQLAGTGVFNDYVYSIGSLNWIGTGDFAANFGAVDKFGIRLTGSSGPGSQYELDNFELILLVPEPETVWMILAVLASLGITFRMRLLELGKQAIARIKA
jgi:hypothetical protein